MKNPLALLKKAAEYLINNPVKSLLSLAVLLDGITKVKAEGQTSGDICHETVFSPTASGLSYTIETTQKSCTALRALERHSSQCISQLAPNTHIHISSFSDIPRIDQTTNRPFKDTLGFSVCDQYIDTAAIVRSKSALGKKIWKGTANPRCPSISFFKEGDPIELRDTEPTELRRLVNDKEIYSKSWFPHCSEETIGAEPGCRMEF